MLSTMRSRLRTKGVGPIQISTKAVQKYGTVQLVDVYGGDYNVFLLG